MSDLVCICCGVSLVFPADPKHTSQFSKFPGHYNTNEGSMCVECHDGKSGRKVVSKKPRKVTIKKD
jgi:hypothetical protein